MLGLHLDRRRAGTHYSDRMHRILGVCHAMGILWHEERVQYREGVSEVHRMEDVRPEGSVLVTPQYEKYGLTVNPRVLSRLKGMAPQLAYALNVANVAVEVAGDVVYVRVPRECGAGDGVVLFEQAWALAPDLGLCLLLGIDEDQKQFILDLKAHNNVHAAVIGMTGSGKSTLMKTMLLSAQMTGGSKIALFDPSGGFQALSGHPSVWRSGLFRRAEDCEIGLEILARGLHRDRSDPDNAPLMYIFVDEVPELVRQRPLIKDYLGAIARAGRQYGYHLIIGAQHPLASELGSDTMRNIPVRLIGRVADRAAAYSAAGRTDSGAEHLRGGGDFVALNGTIKRHFQAAMPSPELLQQWARRYPPRPPRVPARPTVHVSFAGPDPRPTLPLAPEIGSAGGNGGHGRGFDPIHEDLIAVILGAMSRGERIYPYWVRTQAKQLLGHEIRHSKALDHLDEARKRFDIKKGEADAASD